MEIDGQTPIFCFTPIRFEEEGVVEALTCSHCFNLNNPLNVYTERDERRLRLGEIFSVFENTALGFSDFAENPNSMLWPDSQT